MSKNITIQEGGTAKQMTVEKLRTNLVGGGSCLWVPEDTVTLGRKTITENGTFVAADDGLYGYARVTVRGVGRANGTDRDGDDASTTTDSGGALVTKKLPSRLVVDTPPTLTAYADGALIDFSGMVVRACLRSGGVWSDQAHPNGVIPLNELILPVTQADMASVHSDLWTNGAGINAIMLSYTQRWFIDYNDREKSVYVSEQVGVRNGKPAMYGCAVGPTQFFITRYNNCIYTFGSTADRELAGYYFDAAAERGNYYKFRMTTFSTGTGQVKEYGSADEWATAVPNSTVKPTGTPSLTPVSAGQEVPVQWERPEDGKTLETAFEISVS